MWAEIIVEDIVEQRYQIELVKQCTKVIVATNCFEKITSDDISARVTYVMCGEEYTWNFSVLHRESLSNLFMLKFVEYNIQITISVSH
jgi:hypothetical protein